MSRKNQYIKLIDDTLDFIKSLNQAPPAFPKKAPIKEVKREISPSSLPPPQILKKQPEPVVVAVEEDIKPAKQKETKDSFITLDIPVSQPPIGYNTLLPLLKKVEPDLFLHEKIPSDHKAKRIKEAWKIKEATPDIPILTHGVQNLPFLTNIAKAIEIRFASSRVIDVKQIEQEKKWDLFLSSPQVRLIIAPDSTLWDSKELLSFYKENPQKGVRHLGKIPLLLLPDLSLYNKDPYLKRSLWNVICQMLKTV